MSSVAGDRERSLLVVHRVHAAFYDENVYVNAHLTYLSNVSVKLWLTFFSLIFLNLNIY